MPTPRHALHIHLGKLHHWSAFQQPAPHQCQKVHLVFKTTNPNTLHLHSLEQPCSIYIPPKEPQKHLSLYGHALLVTHQHWHPGEDSTTNKRPPQGPLGYSACCGCTELVSDQKREHFLQSPCRNVFLMGKLQKYPPPDTEVGFSKS